MARDTLTINEIGAEGAQEAEDLTGTAYVAANDQQVLNDGNILIIISNGHSASQDITFAAVADPYGRTQDLTVSTDAGEISVAGPFPPALWNQSNGYLYLNGDDETSLTVYAVRFRK